MNLILRFDFSVLNFIQAYMKSPVLDKIMLFFTHMGDFGFVWIAMSVILILIKKYRKDGFVVGLALLIGYIVCNIILKNAFARVRPYNFNDTVTLLINAPEDFSFPSGHTCSSFAAAASMIFVSKKRLALPAAAAALIISFSRLYLYVHYPSDVITGAAVGILSAAAAYKIIPAIPPLRKMKYSKQ